MTYKENYFRQKELRELQFTAILPKPDRKAALGFLARKLREFRRLGRGLRLLNFIISRQEARA